MVRKEGSKTRGYFFQRAQRFSSASLLTLLLPPAQKKKKATSSPPSKTYTMVSKTLLGAGAVLKRGEKLVSPNGKVEAILQDDGNFVVYIDKKDVWARSVFFFFFPFRFSSLIPLLFSLACEGARVLEREITRTREEERDNSR